MIQCGDTIKGCTPCDHCKDFFNEYTYTGPEIIDSYAPNYEETRQTTISPLVDRLILGKDPEFPDVNLVF